MFALLAHKEQETLDPLDVTQWSFHVVPTHLLDEQKGEQEWISLSAVTALSGGGVGYGELHVAVTMLVKKQR